MEQTCDEKVEHATDCTSSFAEDNSEQNRSLRADAKITRKIERSTYSVAEKDEAFCELHPTKLVRSQYPLSDIDTEKSDSLYNNIIKEDGFHAVSSLVSETICPAPPQIIRSRALPQSQDSHQNHAMSPQMPSGIKKPLLTHLKSSSDPESTSCSDSPSSSSRHYVASSRSRSGSSHVTFGEDASITAGRTNDVRDVMSNRSLKVKALPTASQREELQGGTSSEEDSVAEMDYISENSNISVSGTDLIPLENHPTTISPSCIANVEQFITNQASLGSPTIHSPSADGSQLFANSTLSIGSMRNQKSRIKGKVKSLHKSKTSAPVAFSGNHGSTDRFRSIAKDRQVNASTIVGSKSRAPSVIAHVPEFNDSINESRNAEGMILDDKTQTNDLSDEHGALYLPKFRDLRMWTASHAANCPSEDRSASLVNLLLQPLPPNFDSETQLMPLEPDYKVLIRLNLWAVIDGHGGGCVATYGSEVLLPHIAASISRALGCAIVDRGVCTVNGQLRDANALDLDGLIQTSDRCIGNPNSIHYRSPFERSDSDADEEDECDGTNFEDGDTTVPHTRGERTQIKSLIQAGAQTLSGSLLKQKKHQRNQNQADVAAVDASVSSVKTSVKTAASAPVGEEALVGTHSPQEVAAVTRAITESFLAVDEAWINSIDPVATHQTSCQSNGRWNSGACALVVFTIQRLVWTSVSEPDREKESMEPEKSRRNTNQNRDAARRRMLDYASRTKSSMSTVSSTSSLTTKEAVHASGIESEITETEGEDDDRSFNQDVRKREPDCLARAKARFANTSSLISPPGGCSCHCYRAHSAMIYTAHVGDCRAVMLGSAPPRTIKVGDFSSLHQDTTDDESSHHSSDETECLSSSDHDADSSEEEEVGGGDAAAKATNTATSAFINFPRRVARQRNVRRGRKDDSSGPFIALPPLATSDDDTTTKSVEVDFNPEMSQIVGEGFRKQVRVELSDSSSTSSQDTFDLQKIVHLPAVTRPIDLTTDHSAYNPAEVSAVLRRCNNAPRAISAGVGGGIKRVAGSLAVTRALGDAYLKTPMLSFLPYKSHAPYITARPEVNCRPLLKEGDKVLILATDGVWERASGEDVLRWVRNFYEERLAEAVRRANRRPSSQLDKSKSSSDEDVNDGVRGSKTSSYLIQQEGSERDLFEQRNDSVETTISRKRENASSPVQNSSSPAAKRRRRSGRPSSSRISYNVADVIVRRVLNKVRRARNISSLQALMSLPQGRARRSKHDDITASVIDLSAFVS